MTIEIPNGLSEDEALDHAQFILGGTMMSKKIGDVSISHAPQHGVGDKCRKAYEATEHEGRTPLKFKPEDRI